MLLTHAWMLRADCFGSWRQIWREKKQHTKPPVSLVGQLFWREFFYTAAALTPNFHRMAGSPICRQIPWDDNEEFYRAWDEARTGKLCLPCTQPVSGDALMH